MSVKDWKQLGYSDKQSEELERLSHISDDIGDIGVHVADKILREAMKKIRIRKGE